jgi:hypothetical protein
VSAGSRLAKLLVDLRFKLENSGMSAFDAVDGSSTGIAVHQIAPAIQSRPMSLIGTLQTSMPTLTMSAQGAVKRTSTIRGLS